LGWRVEPGKLKLESDTREAVAPQLVVYPPHSEVKLKIMRAAMLPHIKSYRALRRHLIEQDIIVPPFAEEFRTQSYRRSVLRQVFTTTPAGRVYLRPDESLVPSTTMLKPILLDPLAIGVKLYGSGEGGVYALRRHFKFAEKSDVVPDCQILPVKVCMGTFPELAICRTNEEVTLYRDVCRKWARVDLDIQWEVNHRTDLLTPNPGQSAGRPSGPPRGSSRANPWAGYVLCGRHGMDKDCAPIVARHLRLSAATGNWQCTTEYNKQETDRTCSNWGDNNILGRVLDTHLLRSIEYALQNDAAIIQCVATGESATARKARVAAELREVKDAYDDAMAAYTQLQRMWKEIDPASVDAETKDYFARNVKPLALVYSDKKKEVEKLGTADGVPSVGTEQEITDALRFAIANWDKLSVDRKSHVIGLLVSHVTVQVTNGAESREGVVYFTWRNGWTDRIVSWRGWFLDDRPWSEEEDATLEELWKSDCSWQEIANRLQPHRRFNRTHRRAMHLGVARNAGRSSQWIQAGRDSERTWHDDNPDVLYLILEPGNDPRECLGVWSREKSAVMAIPETVLHGLQVTISACASRRSGS